MKRILLVVLCAALFASTVALAADPVFNETDTIEQDEWMIGVEEPTLENVITMLQRVSSYAIIGSGEGGLVPGILVGMLVVGAVGFNRVGFVAGGVATGVSAMAITSMGIGPMWFDAAFLMVLGLVLAVVYLRFR